MRSRVAGISLVTNPDPPVLVPPGPCNQRVRAYRKIRRTCIAGYVNIGAAAVSTATASANFAKGSVAAASRQIRRIKQRGAGRVQFRNERRPSSDISGGAGDSEFIVGKSDEVVMPAT